MILRQCRHFEVQKYHFEAMIYLLLSKLCKNEITMRNKIEVRVVLMVVYGYEWKMDAMQSRMRLQCGTKLKWNKK